MIYYITKAGDTDSFRVMANKMINGVEEEMGVIEFKLDRKNKRLFSNDNRAVWSFHLKKNRQLSGTLFYKGSLYRIVSLTKQL